MLKKAQKITTFTACSKNDLRLKISQNQSLYENLRKEFPYFEYQSYHFWEDNAHFHLKFTFSLAGKYLFEPETSLPKRQFLSSQGKAQALNWIAFHIGMVELISYWKIACPPKVIIRPFVLDKQQIEWWKKLYFNGLGEFFYVNGIEADRATFMDIYCNSEQKGHLFDGAAKELVLVPVGGGKDSVVSLELISKSEKKCIPFIVNPRKATLDSIHTAGFRNEEAVFVHRSLDPLMLHLNNEGFLNGHTPFSALLAFTTAFVALLADAAHIALSNESSASEPTVIGQNVNHQYSKSLEFEDDFRWYMNQHLLKNTLYFSFLRPMSELQIAAVFSRLEAYHPVFRSCNVGSKTDSWCNNCPKCLFTFLMLQTFLPREKTIRIFGEDLLSKPSLQNAMNDLAGKTEAKPFECVGTVDEVELAAKLLAKRFSPDKPLLLSNFGEDVWENNEKKLTESLTHFAEHRLPDESYLKLLRHALED